MKKNGTSSAVLAPDTRGWRLRLDGGETRTLPTIAEVVAAIPAQAHLELALPCNSVLLERHKLPATDRAELADMLQLQLEKTLPFPVDEVSHGFEVIGQDNNESTVLSVAASHAELDQICGPLRDQGMLPERITLHALLRVAACPPSENTLAIWPEQDQLVVAIANGGKLGWAQTIPSVDPAVVMTDLPGLLIAAEIDGVPTEFDSIRLAPECMNLEPALAELFKKPVQPLADTTEPGKLSQELDLLPQSWQYEAKQRDRDARLKQNLLLVAVLYLVLIAAAFVYLAVLQSKGRKLATDLTRMKPNYADIDKQTARSAALAPAFLPERSAAEVMYALEKRARGNPNLDFTSFSFSASSYNGQGQWTLKLEGTTEGYFDFSQALKKDEDFTSRYDITYGLPSVVKDDRSNYTITGKPKAPPPPVLPVNGSRF